MAEINKDWRTFTSQRQWHVYFKTELPKNDILLKRAILIIYNLQTASEREKDRTKERNGVGFNSVDDKVLTKIAKKLESKISLNSDELIQARTRMPKYWKQLMNHAINKQNS